MQVLLCRLDGGTGKRRDILSVFRKRDYDAEKIKDILRTDTSSVAIEARLVALAAWMKEYYGGTMIQALKTVLPIKRTEQQKEQRILKRCISREAGE